MHYHVQYAVRDHHIHYSVLKVSTRQIITSEETLTLQYLWWCLLKNKHFLLQVRLVVPIVEVWATESRIVLDSRRCRTSKRPTSAGRTTWPATRLIGRTLDPGCDAAQDAEISKETLILKYAGQSAGTGRSISQVYSVVSVTLLA